MEEKRMMPLSRMQNYARVRLLRAYQTINSWHQIGRTLGHSHAYVSAVARGVRRANKNLIKSIGTTPPKRRPNWRKKDQMLRRWIRKNAKIKE